VQIVTIRQQTGFAEFVGRIDAHLDHEEQQEDAGDLKEPSDIDQVPKPGPPKSERDCRK